MFTFVEEFPVRKESVAQTGLLPGQRYVAKRCGPPRIFTCLEYISGYDLVISKETTMAYGARECFLLMEGLDEREVKVVQAAQQQKYEDWSKANLGRI